MPDKPFKVRSLASYFPNGSEVADCNACALQKSTTATESKSDAAKPATVGTNIKVNNDADLLEYLN